MIKPILAAFAALLAVPALAAPAEDFNGPYVGVQGGWQQDHERLRIEDGGTTDRFGDRKAGFTYGGQAGYDFRLSPQFVFGVEGSVTGRTGKQDFSDSAGDDYRLKTGRTLEASARLGVLVTPRGLLYARAGYENARFKLESDSTDDISRNRGGYVAGVGYEQALTHTVSARVEYDYSNFGHERLNDLASDLAVDSASAKFDRNAVTAGLNFHF